MNLSQHIVIYLHYNYLFITTLNKDNLTALLNLTFQTTKHYIFYMFNKNDYWWIIFDNSTILLTLVQTTCESFEYMFWSKTLWWNKWKIHLSLFHCIWWWWRWWKSVLKWRRHDCRFLVEINSSLMYVTVDVG